MKSSGKVFWSCLNLYLSDCFLIIRFRLTILGRNTPLVVSSWYFTSRAAWYQLSVDDAHKFELGLGEFHQILPLKRVINKYVTSDISIHDFYPNQLLHFCNGICKMGIFFSLLFLWNFFVGVLHYTTLWLQFASYF